MIMNICHKKGFVISFIDVKRLLYYVAYHDDRVSRKLKHIKRHMKLANYEEVKHLMLLQIADAKAHIQIPIIAERVEICSALATNKGEELYQMYLKECNK